MSAVGYAVLPTTISLAGLGKELQKQLAGPVSQAAKKAGKSIEDGIGSAMDKATKDVERASRIQSKSIDAVANAEQAVAKARSESVQAVEKQKAAELDRERVASASAAKLEAAERKWQKLKESGKATTEQLAAAEQKVNDARLKGAADVARKEAALEKARQNAVDKANAVAKAEDKVKSARDKAEQATENLTAAHKRLENAQEQTESSAKGLGKWFRSVGDDAEGMTDALEDAGSKFGDFAKMAGGLAGVAGLGEFFTLGNEVSGAIDQMNNQMGASGAAAAQFGAEVKDALKGGIAGGAEEAAGAIGSLHSQFENLGVGGEQTANELADNFLAFSKTFEVDIAEATQTAGQLIQNGLAADVEGAADLMTAAMQRVPAQMRDELPEIINEYGVNFANLGLSGEEAFTILVNQADRGKWALDKTGDALKEFTIRGSDMSAASVAAYEQLGLSAEEMSAKIAAGGDGARQAMEQTAQKLLEIEDPAERANAAIALFGTPLEDLGIDQIPQFLEGLTGLEGGMDGAAGASQRLSDSMADSFPGRVKALKGAVAVLAEEGFMKLWDWGSKVADWAVQNSSWVTPLVAGMGAVAAAIGGITLAQTLWNAALAVSPITWIAGAVVGLGVALWAFFTKTETGRQIWDACMNALSAGWEMFKSAFSAGWQFLVQNVWTPFITRIQELQGKWSAFVGVLNAAWDSFKAKAAEVVATAIAKIAEMVQRVQEIPGKIKSVFADAGSWLRDAGSRIIDGLWSGLTSAFENVKNWLGNLPSMIRNSIGSISFDIGAVFSRNAQGSIHSFAGGGREDHKPMIANGGPIRVWAEPEVHKESYIPWALDRRDRATAILAETADGFGWSLVNQKTGELYKNTYGKSTAPMDVQKFADGGITGDDMVNFAKGKSVNGYQAALPLEGAPYVWGGGHPNWGDCSGTVGVFSALAIGENPAPRRFATGSQADWLSSHGFKRGRGGEGDFRVGFKNGGPGGGHTAATLPNGVNVEMGGARGNGQYGGQAAGAWDSYFDQFFYLPMKPKVWNDPKVTGLGGELGGNGGVVEVGDYSGMSTTSTASAEPARPLTPQEAAAQEWANGMGNRSLAELGIDALGGFLGEDFSLTKKLLFTPMDELLGVSDQSTYAVGQPSTSVAQEHAAQINDAAVTSMTPEQLRQDEQLKPLATEGTVVKQEDKGPSWGPEYFAREIARKAKSMGLDALAAKIGLATALVESGNPLKMWANRAVPESLKFRHDAIGSDYDSVGLFQQRDNGAWGTVKERMTPFDSAGMFFNKLKSFDYRAMDPGAAAQKVQVSAFPDRYAQQMGTAQKLLDSTNVFDTGGILGTGRLALNLGKPERILDAEMTPLFDKFIGFLPNLMDTLDAARMETTAALRGQDFGYGVLSGFIGERAARDSVNLAAAGETVLQLNVDPDDLITAGGIQRMVNEGVDGLRMELRGRRAKATAVTRGGAM